MAKLTHVGDQRHLIGERSPRRQGSPRASSRTPSRNHINLLHTPLGSQPSPACWICQVKEISPSYDDVSGQTPQLRTPRAATPGLGQPPSLKADPSARVCLSCRRCVEAPSGQEDPTDMDTKVGKNAHQTRHPREIIDFHGIA